MDKRKKLILSWTMVILWMIVIFMFSGQSGDESGGLSEKVLKVITDVLPFLRGREEVMHFFVRKAAHLTEYAILGALIGNAFYQSERKDYKAAIIAVLITGLYAIADEYHQGLVPGRGPSVRDVLIDTAGGIIGVFMHHMARRLNWKKEY